MPKNKGKGGKNRKRGTNKNDPTKRQLDVAEEQQTYARVTKMLGGGRVWLQCQDGRERLGVIRGKMRRRVWVNNGDVVLLALRDFQDDKADIISKFRPEEVEKLVKLRHVPESFAEGVAASAEGGGGMVTFANVDDEEEDDDEAARRRRRREVPAEDEDDDEDDEEDDDEEDEEDEEGEEEDEEEEEEEEDLEAKKKAEEEEKQRQRDFAKPKVKDKRLLRQERKGGKPSAPSGPAPRGAAQMLASAGDVDVDDL
eukprot:TRINITY_DN473_c0_g2_i1.p1 TRINITY_DN473_c0_g2~~TRINITY_DN473_c0_g2_i1.p1  ORF type:complete len:280 (+),score=85.41 TRINITY_DN473_c0_g2_i1:78-842(+)